MADTLAIGDRVYITDPQHPWTGRAGEILSAEETYGLGWKGYRLRVDDTCGQETYVRLDQVMGPGRVDRMVLRTRSGKRLTATRRSR